MKIKSSYSLFFLIFLLSGIFCTSCAPKIAKPSTFPQYITGKNESTEVEKLIGESFKFYYQGQFTEAVKTLETAIQIISQEPSSSLISLYTLLEFFQDKSGNIDKTNLTSANLRDLFKKIKIKNDIQESDALALRLIKISQQLKPIDRIQFWERLRPIIVDTSGKSGEAFALWQIAEAYIAINDYSKAYECGTEALKLAKESNQTVVEVNTSLLISRSLIGLGRIHEAENILREVLPKTEGNPFLKANTLAQSALIHGMLGHKEQTVKFLQEAISIAQSSGLTYLESALRFGLGGAYLPIGEKEKGKQEFMNALALSEKLGDKFQLALLEIAIANNFLGVGLFEEAYHYAMRAADSYKKLGMRIEEAKSLRIAGQSLGSQNKIDEGLKLYEKAALIQVDEKDRDGVSETLWSAVNILRSLGRLEDVRQVLLIGLNTHTSVFRDDIEGERRIRWELAKVYDELGRFYEALKQFAKVLYIYDQLGDKKGEILTLIEVDKIFAELNDYESRIKALSWAEKLGSEIDDPSIKITILNQTAVLFRELGNIVEALQNYIESIEISKSMNKQVQYTQLGLLGYFYTQIGEYTKAIQCFEEEIKIVKEINDQRGIANTQMSISYCYLSMGKYDDAIQSAHDAIKILRGIKKDTIQITGETLALSFISSALEYQEKYEDALKVQQERLEIAKKSSTPLEISHSYDRIGYIYLELGRYIEAIENFKKAIQMIELMRLGAEYEKYQIGFLSKQLSPYDGIISAYYQLHHKSNSMKSEFVEEALSFAEKSKSRTWLTQLTEARARSIWEVVPLEVEREGIDLVSKSMTANEEYENAINRLGISAHEIEEKKNAKDIAYEKWSSFTEKIRRQYPKLDKFFFRPSQLNELTHIQLNELTVKGEETLILYKVTLDWVYAWVVIRKGDQNKILKFTQLPSKTSEIEKIIKKLLLPYRKGKYKGFDVNVSSELYNKIIGPVIERVEITKRLIIIPDGMLNVIPFEVLVTRKGCNNNIKSPCYFGDQFIISYYPSATILTLAREAIPKTLPAQGSLLAVGDPIYGLDDESRSKSQISFLQENGKKDKTDFTLRGSRLRKGVEDKGYSFERLKHSGLEVQKIKGIFENMPGDKEVLIGLDASEDQIKSRDLTRYQYLHFAVHGILAFDLPHLNEPALVLAMGPDTKEDGFLTLREIYELKLNADLVTLSACKTGLGLRVSGEGVIGLSRAFMIAGARAVVVSLWEVDDHSTALLMEEFYKQLAQGVNKVEALVKAKQKLRQMGYENPYFWGPFILIGD